MKIRQDFVTNSSSTSFLISLHGEFTQENFLKGLRLNPDFLLHPMFEEMFEIVDRCKQDTDELMKSYSLESVEDFLDRMSFNEETIEIFNSYLAEKWKIYSGYFSDDCSPLEQYLCFSDFLVHNEDIFFATTSRGM
ncbi:MAG: hypothetical protein LBP22_05650 [Deltaproteobacteria bacterium]|jgi:hypothetical protein|nr:hypothetical protein [Deltaproteobacteria bacterium]